MNTSKRTIAFFGTVLELSKYEYDILKHFIERKGHVFSREQLMDLVWEEPEPVWIALWTRTSRISVQSLRAVRPDLEPIVTHRGTGYSLRDDL